MLTSCAFLLILGSLGLPWCSCLRFRVDVLTPVVNRDYWVYASLELLLRENTAYSKQFYFTGLGETCRIEDWKFCNNVPKKPARLTCSCYSRRVHGNFVTYRFFFFIGKVGPDQQGSVIRASLGGGAHSDTILDVVDFKRKPSDNGELQICEGKRMALDWEYGSESEAIADRFQVTSMEWSFIRDDSPILLAKLQYDKYRRADTYVPVMFRESVSIETEDGFHKLVLIKPFSENRTTVYITLSFNKTRFNRVRAAKPLEWIELDSTLFRKGRAANNSGDEAAEAAGQTTASAPEATVVPSIITSTAKTTMSTDSTTTIVPELDYRDEVDLFSEVTDSVDIMPLSPPTDFLSPQLVITKTLTGSFMITCSVQKSDNLGSPEVNISIWRKTEKGNKTLMFTTQGKSTLRETLALTGGFTFLCTLEGEAMLCVEEDAAPRRVASTNISDVVQESKAEGIDSFLLMYAIETFTIVSVIMWVLSNLIQHIRLLLWYHKMQIKERVGTAVMDRVRQQQQQIQQLQQQQQSW